ncbi:MAG: serpin family protein, partial [Chthoniobacterales bacterium]
MKWFWICLGSLAAFVAAMPGNAAEFDSAATATNQLGLDLHRQLATGQENLCLSPYSIESALAMTFAGADGETKTQMARVLHLQGGDEKIHGSFTSLQRALNGVAKNSAAAAEEAKKAGGSSEP